jgi:hypothetical protein
MTTISFEFDPSAFGALRLAPNVFAREMRIVDDEAVSLEILSWDLGAGETQALPTRIGMVPIEWSSTAWRRVAAPGQWASRSTERSAPWVAPSTRGKSNGLHRSSNACARPACT